MTALKQLDTEVRPPASAPLTLRWPAAGALQKSVLVYERPDAFRSIAALLRQIDCIPFDARESFFGDHAQIAPHTVLISDSINDPIAVCRALPPTIPKIIVASDASFAFRCAAVRAGVNAIVKRPVDVNELSDWLEHFDNKRSEAPISVLLIDDHVLTTELYGAVLERAGMTVKIINRPEEALVAIEEMSPDLVLMDLEMPGVDGIELAQIIRQTRDYLSIPIAFLSAETDESRQVTARESGGDDFIRKPVELKRLPGLVRLRATRARTMRSLIERDSLTGLLNHGRFKTRVSTEVERSRRTGASFSLAMIDLDHFKTINDTYGHPAGDKVIRALSRTLTSRLRAIDVIGRCGGEEFGILLLDTPPARALEVVDELRALFGKLRFEEPGGSFSVTFSAGVAGSADRDLSRLFVAADAALYRAKRKGRNKVDVANPATHKVDAQTT